MYGLILQNQKWKNCSDDVFIEYKQRMESQQLKLDDGWGDRCENSINWGREVLISIDLGGSLNGCIIQLQRLCFFLQIVSVCKQRYDFFLKMVDIWSGFFVFFCRFVLIYI